MKKKLKILITVTCILAVLIVFSLDLFYRSAKRIRTRRETLSSEKIGTDLDGMKIVYFSDLDYGQFMDAERLQTLTEKITDADPDVIIFGGDLYAPDVTPDDTKNSELSSFLSSLEAPLGKFAVYGDADRSSDVYLNAANSVYSAANVEVLNNSSVNLHNYTSESITLVGLDSGLNGTPDTAAAYSAVSRTSYVLTVCHTPDTADQVPADLTDYFLAGHSHGGQIYYGLGAFYTPAFAVTYFRGKNDVNQTFTLDITNGVGTRGRDMRFNAPAEIVVYTLDSTVKEQNEKEETTAEPAATAAPSASSSSAASAG